MRHVPEAKPRVPRLISSASSDVSSAGTALWLQRSDLPDSSDKFSLSGLCSDYEAELFQLSDEPFV